MVRRAIELVVSDNEGCFVEGKGRPIDLAPIAELRSLLRATGVRLTFCTGRSVPYMEAICQFAGLTESSVPLICEGGAVLYWPATDRHQLVCDGRLESSFLGDLPEGAFRIEPGKVACVSLYPEHPETVESLAARVRGLVDGQGTVQTSAAAVDVTPLGVDKGSGLEALSLVSGISVEDMLCVGDSANDLPMLRMAGRSAAPANASEDVKRVVDYVSPRAYAAGLLDIVERHMKHFNRMT